MPIDLNPTARDALVRALRTYLKDEFDVEAGGMEAMVFLDFITERFGPHIYNQALHDARALLQVKLEAMGESLYEIEKPAKL